MKKENEVLQAAQTGNLAKLEGLFEQRSPKVFAGFFKGPNINWRNESGCTALHLAALNGHVDCVIFLLHNDASANTPDNAGSFPLHLAAFNGHEEVARILLEKGPSRAQVNEPNMAGDTALHVAALYNHHNVMDVLLKHHADIFIRNDKGETALDLASQYGRYLAVQMLIFKDTRILKDAVHKHSPLHLAARNGHVEVVKLLLDSGMPVNATCDMGTALHASALFGKVDVAKLLLRKGVDIEIGNNNGEKVLDLLCKIPSQRSQQITALIYEQSDLMLEAANVSLSANSFEEIGYKVADNSDGIRTDKSQRKKRNPLDNYDYVPKFRNKTVTGGSYPYALVEGIGRGSRRPSNNSKDYNLVSLTGNKEKDKIYSSSEEVTAPYCLVDYSLRKNEIDMMVTTECNNLDIDTKKDSKISRPYSQPLKSSDMDNLIKIKPEITQGNLISMQEDAETIIQKESLYDIPPKSNIERLSRSSIPSFPPPSPNTANAIIADAFESTAVSNDLPVPKNQVGSLVGNDVPYSNDHTILSDAAYNLLGIKPLSKSVPVNIGIQNNSNEISSSSIEEVNSYDTYDNVKLKNVPVIENYGYVNLCKTSAPDPYDNVHIKNIPSNSFFGREVNNERSHKKALKQKRTRNLTSDSIPTDKNLHSDIKQEDSFNLDSDKPTITEHNNIYLDNSSDKTEVLEEQTPIPKPRGKVKQSHTTVQNISTGYRMSVNNKQIMDESYEWNKIDKFVSELELYAEEGSTVEQETKFSISTESIPAWLNSFGLIQYEPMFLTNGFDEIAFLNGVLSDQDLVELGILHSGHRKRIMEACQILPKSPVLGDDDFPIPDSVNKWLAKLKLSDYERRFIQYGYDNMERIRVIWELELITVLEITIIGHRKRMISSLGIPPLRKKDPVSLLKKSNNSDSIKKKDISFIDDSMNVAKQLLETAESLKVERNHRLSKLGEKSSEEKALITSMSKTSESLKEDQLVSNSQNIEWKHNKEFLERSSVSYVVQYLGSHPVQKVQGVASTLEACAKMKTISLNIHKMPYVMLTISIRGIDYIDSNTNMVISQYAIKDISYCAQDPSELSIFAYIARDEFTKKKYCHVFRVDSIKLADEIIITIGQCFELAYKQHLKAIEKAKRSESEKCVNNKSMPLSVRKGGQSNNCKQTGKRMLPQPPKPYTGKIVTSNGRI